MLFVLFLVESSVTLGGELPRVNLKPWLVVVAL